MPQKAAEKIEDKTTEAILGWTFHPSEKSQLSRHSNPGESKSLPSKIGDGQSDAW